MSKGRVEVNQLAAKASWFLTQADVDGLKFNDKLESPPIRLLGHTLALRFYPQGCVEPGKSSLYVVSDNASTGLRFELALCPGGNPVEVTGGLASGVPQGVGILCAAPSIEEFACSVTVLEVGDEAQALEVQELKVRDVFASIGAMTRSKTEAESKLAALQAAKEVGESRIAVLSIAKEVTEAAAALEASALAAISKVASSALAIQRMWRGAAVRARTRREKVERSRRAKWVRSVSAIVTIQNLWRDRRRRVQLRRHRLDATRMRRHSGLTKYDIVFKLRSLAEFVETGKIDFVQSVGSLFNAAAAAQYRIVAVVGLVDKGKTFLVNKLLGINLPCGKLCTTRGLSFYWVEERRLLVLDCAGVQAAVSHRAQAVHPILDAQTTESLLFEMIARIAHHLIFVVNELTWLEQKYIAMLHQKYVQSGAPKELIVVHNLRTTGIVEEAKLLFRRQATQRYEGQTSHLGGLYFTADHGDQAPPVHHVGFCDDATAAGSFFNCKSCDLILQMLELRNMRTSCVALVDCLQQELARLLPIFLNVELADSLLHIPKFPVDFVLSTDAEAVDGYRQFGILVLQTPEPSGRIALKTKGVISTLGETIAHDVSFDPVVNVYDQTSDDETRRWIEVEAPGVTLGDIALEELPNGVKLTLHKRKGIHESAVEPVSPIRQHHGKWERDFQFDASAGKFEVDLDTCALREGIFRVALRRQVQPRRWTLGHQSRAAPMDTMRTGVTLPPRVHAEIMRVVTPASSIATLDPHMTIVPLPEDES